MIRLAIVGLGRWGTILVRSVQGKSDLARFTVAVSRSPGERAELAAELDLEVVPTLAAALAHPEVDAVVLASPHSHHADEIAAAAKAGKPVLVEKPFTLDRASADRAVAGGEVLFAAAHNRRFLPAVMMLKKMIEDGDLGEILHLETNFSGNVVGRYTRDIWRVAEGESPAGGLAGSGIHMIDLIIHLAGPVSEVYAISSRRVLDLPMDDTTAVVMRLASGASAALTTIVASAGDFRLKLFGTKGSAELATPEKLVITPVGGEPRIETFPPIDMERAEIEAFALAVAGTKPYPISLDDVLNGVSVFEGVSRSIEARAPVATT